MDNKTQKIQVESFLPVPEILLNDKKDLKQATMTLPKAGKKLVFHPRPSLRGMKRG